MREHIRVEWPLDILTLLFIPFEGADTELECIHSGHAVLVLLIPIFERVEYVTLIFETDAKPRKFRVYGNEICCFNRLQD